MSKNNLKTCQKTCQILFFRNETQRSTGDSICLIIVLNEGKYDNNPRSWTYGGKRPESTGKRWKVEAVFQLEVTGFFSCRFRSTSRCKTQKTDRKTQETDRNPQEKNPVTSNWNTASSFQCFPVLSGQIRWFLRIFPAGSYSIRPPESLTWVCIRTPRVTGWPHPMHFHVMND